MLWYWYWFSPSLTVRETTVVGEAVKEEDRAKKKIGDMKRWKGLWSHLEVDCSLSLSLSLFLMDVLSILVVVYFLGLRTVK